MYLQHINLTVLQVVCWNVLHNSCYGDGLSNWRIPLKSIIDRCWIRYMLMKTKKRGIVRQNENENKGIIGWSCPYKCVKTVGV